MGVGLLSERLQEARQKTDKFVEIKVPNRKDHVIESWTDGQLEQERLAVAGEALADEVWPNDDFGDWES